MKYSGELKNIDTNEKAYILGLLIADGSNTFSSSSGAYGTTLKLKKSDEYLLDNIAELLSFFKKGKTETSKEGFQSEYIRTYSKELFHDLLGHGMFPRKSFENANKVFLPKLSDEMFFAYLHGLCDGNASICQSKEGWIRIDLVSPAKSLLRQLQERLSLLGINSTVYFRDKRNYWILRISRKNNIKSLIERFSETPFCLERKFAPYFDADWDRVPGYDNRGKDYAVWFASTSNP